MNLNMFYIFKFQRLSLSFERAGEFHKNQIHFFYLSYITTLRADSASQILEIHINELDIGGLLNAGNVSNKLQLNNPIMPLYPTITVPHTSNYNSFSVCYIHDNIQQFSSVQQLVAFCNVRHKALVNKSLLLLIIAQAYICLRLSEFYKCIFTCEYNLKTVENTGHQL